MNISELYFKYTFFILSYYKMNYKLITLKLSIFSLVFEYMK